MKSRTRVLTLLSFLAAAVLPALAPQSAQADPLPPCYGPSCVGYSPYYSTGTGSCANGADLESITPVGGGPTITLRWNDWCLSNWARFDGHGGLYLPGSWRWWVETADGTRAYGGGDVSYTEMVDGTQLARACIIPAGYSSPQCTKWH